MGDTVFLISGAGDGDTGGGLCVFDGEKIELIDRVSTAGVTVFEDRLARLLRTPLNTGGGEILIYDHRGVSHYLRIDELSDAHYVAWDGEHLIVSSTGTNSLLWITLGGEVVRRWRAPGEDDSWHLNDVLLAGERTYACAFGRYTHYRDYKNHLMSGDGIVFDIDSGDCVVRGLCAPHSPRYFDGAWTVCDSLANSVVQVDAQGHRTREAKLRSFTRGLAVTDEYLVAGESASREEGNGLATGSVAVLRRSDFSFVRRLDVPFREVSEVVVAPLALMNAAKTGFRTNPLRVSESDQLQMFRDVGMEPQRLWATCDRLAPEQCKVRIAAELPSVLLRGRSALVRCNIHNLSAAFLCSEPPFPVYLSFKWKSRLDPEKAAPDDGNRQRLPSMLPPRTSIDLQLDLQSPDEPGDYEVALTLVQEHVAWFNDLDPSNAFYADVRVVEDKELASPTPAPKEPPNSE